MLFVIRYNVMLYYLVTLSESFLLKDRQDMIFTSNYDNFEDNCTNLILEVQSLIEDDSDVTQNDHFEFCKDKVEITDVKVSCRQDTYVQLEWNVEYEGIITDMTFLIEHRSTQKSSQNKQWINNGWTNRTKYKAEGLTRNTGYSFKLTPYFKKIQLGHAVISSSVTTFSGNETLEPITELSVGNYSENQESLQALLNWITPKDLICQTSLLLYEEGTLEHFSDKVDSGHAYLLKDLGYSSSYVLTLFTSVGRSESEKFTYSFQTPSCLHLNNFNLTKCVPDAPVNLTLEDGCTNFTLFWDRPLVYPDLYKLIFQYEATFQNFTIPGNETSFTFEDYHIGYYYIVYMTAVSSAGESKTVFLSGMFSCVNRESLLTHTRTGNVSSYRNIIIIIAITIPIITIIFVVLCRKVIYDKTVQKDVDPIPIPQDSYTKEACFKKSDRKNSEGEAEKENKGKETNDEMKYDEYEVSRNQVTLCQILGEGEFGVVHKAVLFFGNNFKYVAVKTLRNKESLEEKRQLEKEMEVMKSVGQHRNIVSLLGCCTDDMMLIVEYCALGDLRKYLRKAWRIKAWAEEAIRDRSNKDLLERNAFSNILYEQSDAEKRYLHLSIMNLLSFARQIALGMAYLSDNRVVHRDLAARNVLLAEDMTAKIADFGLSRDVYERNIYTKRSTDRLPLRWMALESLLYQVFSTKSDVWSYGILLWEIMTLGGCPYPSLQTTEMYKLLQEGYRMERPKPCNPQLYEIMLNCWDAKPQNRPSFSRIVDKLENIMKNESNRPYLDLSAFDYKTHLDSGCDVKN